MGVFVVSNVARYSVLSLVESFLHTATQLRFLRLAGLALQKLHVNHRTAFKSIEMSADVMMRRLHRAISPRKRVVMKFALRLQSAEDHVLALFFRALPVSRPREQVAIFFIGRIQYDCDARDERSIVADF